jgi:hypothetical protein
LSQTEITALYNYDGLNEPYNWINIWNTLWLVFCYKKIIYNNILFIEWFYNVNVKHERMLITRFIGLNRFGWVFGFIRIVISRHPHRF